VKRRLHSVRKVRSVEDDFCFHREKGLRIVF
jgi:hypothetical protein